MALDRVEIVKDDYADIADSLRRLSGKVPNAAQHTRLQCALVHDSQPLMLSFVAG